MHFLSNEVRNETKSFFRLGKGYRPGNDNGRLSNPSRGWINVAASCESEVEAGLQERE